jgi:hypothetical protein
MASTTEAAGYYLGLTAWDEYINRLGSLETFNLKPGKEAQLLMLGNAWIYHCLGRHRSSGAWYLRKVSDELGDPVAEHLRKAASLYESMATSVLRDQSHTTQEIAPFPQSPVDQEGWMTGMRYDQIQRLEHARVLEREAVAEIEAAISLLH